jgi:hypothetical protein
MAINLNNIYNQTPKRKGDLQRFDNSNMGGGNPMQSGTFTPNTGMIVNNPMSAALPENATPQEYSKFLYDTGLQNVFNTYQQNMSRLDQSQQKDLQEAYYMRELSKKYLGEYASNLGIGDVSGNLLDMYSAYQQNINKINQSFGELSTQFQDKYDMEQQDLFNQAMQRQMQLETAEQTEAVSQIGFNVATGNTNGLSWLEYLNTERDAGRLTQGEYGTLYRESYLANYQQFNQNFTNGNFGFKTDADGKLTPKTSLDYLEENKSWLNPTDYNNIKQAIQYGEQFPTPEMETGLFVQNSLIESVFDNITSGGDTIQLTITVGGVPNQFVSTNESAGTTLSNTLNEKLEAAGRSFVSGQSYVEHQGNRYVWVDTREGGQWYRMQNVTTVTQDIERWTKPYTDAEGVEQPAEMSTWKAETGEDWDTDKDFVRGNVTFNTHSNSRETTITYQGVVFKFDNDFEKEDAQYDRAENSSLKAAYEAAHGTTKIDNAFFYYQGEFYAVVERKFLGMTTGWFFRRYTKQA